MHAFAPPGGRPVAARPRRGDRRSSPRSAAGLLALTVLAACGGEDAAEPTCVEKNTCVLSIVSGDEQSAIVGQELRAPLVVRVADETGAPAEVTIEWSAGAGEVSTMSTPTNDAGEATVSATLGTTAGPQTFEATLPALPGRAVTFTALALADEAEQIQAVSGDGQTATAGGLLRMPLRARVTDRFGNGVAGAPVTWTAVAGMGSITPGPADRAVTDGMGVTTATATLGPMAGAMNNLFTVAAEGFEADPVVFTASARPGPPAVLSKVMADQQLGGQPGETLAVPLAVRVVDRNMNPVAGATVTYSVIEGMGASLSESSPVTNAAGEAAVQATLGPQPGSYAFTAEVGQVMGSPQTFRATAFPPICSPANWCWKNPLPQGNDIYGAWAASSSRGWLVGELGTILEWNGAAWVSVESNVQANLRDVHGASESLVFAVGDGGIIDRFDGTRWSSVSSGTSAGLAAVWMASATEGWAVGQAGTILRFDGMGWSSASSPTQESLLDVRGLSPSEVWAVGERGTLLRYDGTSWTQIATDFSTDIAGVWPRSATEVWMAGDQESKWLYDGSMFTPYLEDTGSNLLGMWESSSGDLYAFGLRNRLERWDGRRWFPERTAGSEGAKGIHDMIEVGGAPLAVGDDGRFLRENSTGLWSTEAALGDEDFQAIWGASADRAWIVGDSGTILAWDGTSWTESMVNTTIGFRAVTGTSAADVWAVGVGGAAYRFDGSAWSEVRTPTDNELLAVWPLAANEVYAAGGDRFGGAVFRFDGSAWTQMTLPEGTERLRGIYGARADEIWAVGGTDLILRYDGSAWSTVPSPSSSSALQGVRGTAPDDVWAWGTGSTILHYDGTEWRSVQSGGADRINDLWPVARGEAWAVGTSGRILVRSSGGGFQLQSSGASTELFGAWGASTGDVWVVGASGTLLRRESP